MTESEQRLKCMEILLVSEMFAESVGIIKTMQSDIKVINRK